MSETPAEVIRRAEEIEPTDWAAALDLLESANRIVRSSEIEIALAALRWRSFEHLVGAGEPDRAPAERRSGPPIGDRGLPEAPLADLDAGMLRGALLEHGCLLVPGALDADRARSLALDIDRGFAAQDPAGGEPSGSSWWSPLALDPPAAASLGRKWVRGGGGVLLADSPRLMFEVLDLFSELGLRALVADYLGSRPVLSANKCTLRRVSMADSGDWHQDGAFLGRGVRAINLWLTLTACGVDAPSLDLVLQRFDDVVETGTEGAHFDWAVGPDVAERVAAGRVLRPRFDAGDLLIFDDLLLHRTANDPAMTRPRHAIEMWSFASDAYPTGQVPMVW